MRLQEIDLTQAEKHEHPAIWTDGRAYLCQIDGQLFAGTFSRQHYGLNFRGWTPNPGAGLQFDAPGWNGSRWERVWAIIEEPSDYRINATHEAARRVRASELEAARRRREAED